MFVYEKGWKIKIITQGCMYSFYFFGVDVGYYEKVNANNASKRCYQVVEQYMKWKGLFLYKKMNLAWFTFLCEVSSIISRVIVTYTKDKKENNTE